MHIKTLHIPNARLKEGDYYVFRLLKTISLGADETYYVMLDPSGYRIMMPVQYYAYYGFEEGQEIVCRIDKVNCNGKVYLEPRHPYYREGNTYPFAVVNAGKRKNILDQEEHYFIVKDRTGNEWTVVSHAKIAEATIPSHVECFVKRIKKGVLYLQLAGEPDATDGFLPGGYGDFCVLGEATSSDDGLSWYVLEDASGRRCKLRKKYYVNYGLRKGSVVRCKVMGYGLDAFPELEPEHPCYNPGEVTAFKVKRWEKLVFSDGSQQMVLVFADCFGEDVKVHVDEEVAAGLAGKTEMNARVMGVYKSRPELELAL